jgi:hypothetical protein
MDDGVMTAYAEDLQTGLITAYDEEEIEMQQDPEEDAFEYASSPNRPPSNSSANTGRSLTAKPVPRLITSHLQAESDHNDTVYESHDYADPSRPTTRFDPGPSTATPEMPATSILLPWLSKGIHTTQPARSHQADHPQYAVPGPSRQPLAYQPDIYTRGSAERSPPRAALARTPIPGSHKGWEGVIPTFRS